MPCRSFAAVFVVAVFLVGGGRCGRPAQGGRTPATGSLGGQLAGGTHRGPRRISRRTSSVIFYPTYACQAGGEAGWTVALHGSIFEPELGSLKRGAALALLCTALGLPRKDAETETFRERARPFLVDNERGKQIAVRLGDKVYSAGTSEPNGHFSATLQFTAAEAERLRGAADPQGRLDFQAVTRRGDDRTFAGRVQWIAPEGRSVISDIDDTIKISNVQDLEAVVANTFLRESQARAGDGPVVSSMGGRGRRLPLRVRQPLAALRTAGRVLPQRGFPAGTFNMKLFRLKDSSALSLFKSQEGYKTEIIEKILADFPRRQFTLVGDSGEADPEIYAAAARKHPEQIQHVFIRNVGGRGAEPARFREGVRGDPHGPLEGL